jgi:hypothetical protein
MKHLRPHERHQIVQDHIRHLEQAWLCRYGTWSRDKLMVDLERALMARRKERKRAHHSRTTQETPVASGQQ